MAPTFTHAFEDLSADGMLSIETDAEAPAKIRGEIDKDGNIWIIANPDGWLHLAKVCAELGLANYEDGYHFHKDRLFAHSNGAPEISFMVDSADDV